jgi:hypothetical protein
LGIFCERDTTPLKADKDPPPLPCIVIHTTLEPKPLRKGRRIFEGHKNVEEVRPHIPMPTQAPMLVRSLSLTFSAGV